MFINRFKSYITGVVIGSIVVYFTLVRGREDKLTQWLPANRVKYDIFQKPYAISNTANCQLTCLSIDTSSITPMLKNAIFSVAERNSEKGYYKYKFEIKSNDSTAIRNVFFSRTKAEILLENIESSTVCNCNETSK